MLRIIDTTDRKNMGRLIPEMQVGERVMLEDGYVFEPTSVLIAGGNVRLANSNYIIIAQVKEA